MDDLWSRLVCPSCRAHIAREGSAAHCSQCGRSYPIIDEIPVLLSPDSTQDTLKAMQARWFDREPVEEFEIERPHGTPALYGWYYADKFRRGTDRIRPGAGASALAICGGSGMDAEFLAQAGWRVVSADVSLGASRRAQERSRRQRLDMAAIVADAEQLPFADGSFDLVYVHDGLHHIGDPIAAMREMTRVARTAISVNEPARAAMTAVAVRIGLALRREEAGNEVHRLTLREVETVLRDEGFHVVSASRYGMYFRHEPGRFIAWLSRPVPSAVVRSTLELANARLGRVGNKLAVQAVRETNTANNRGHDVAEAA